MSRIMTIFFFMLLTVVCAVTAQAQQMTITASRKILLPDGRPAVGATVTIYTFQNEQATTTTTDADGIFSARVQIPAGLSRMHKGYILVSLPQYALCVGRLTEATANGRQFSEPGFFGFYDALILQTDFQQAGMVVDDATGAPVPQASVVVVEVNHFPFNVPSQDLNTPAFMTTTDDAGRFTLDGVVVEEGLSNSLTGSSGRSPTGRGSPLFIAPGVVSVPVGRNGQPDYSAVSTATASIVAMARDGDTVRGATTLNFRFSPFPADTPQTLRLEKAIPLEGKVLDSVTHAPVKGARVNLSSRGNLWVTAMPKITTNADGAYRTYLLAGGRVFITTDHQDYCPGWAECPCPTQSVEPLMTVTGRVIDVASGDAPLVPLHMRLLYRQGTFDNTLGWLGTLTLYGNTRVDGAFTMRVPVSGGVINFDGPGYAGSGMIAASATGPVTWQATRRDGILLHCTTNHPDGFLGDVLWYKDAAGRAVPSFNTPDSSGFIFLDAKQFPGDQVSISLKCNGVEVLPWSTVEKGKWPNDVELP